MGLVSQIFACAIMFEKLKLHIKFFNSAKNNNNQLTVVSKHLNSDFLFIYKNSLQGYHISLIDATGVDISKLSSYISLLNTNIWAENWQNLTKLIYYNTLNYKTNERLILTAFTNINTEIKTLENVFYNSNWIERELVEFFNFNINGKNDNRNLLLDYNLTTKPLLKSYPTEGHQEIFFNYLTYNVDYVQTEFIEL